MNPYALFTLIRKKNREKALAETIDTTSTTSFDETNDQSMTTISSGRRFNGRKDSSTIPTPRIHSSSTNTRRSKKLILDSNEIILEPQIDHKNVNHYNPTIPELTLHQSEQLIERKYTNLLINFFETHQPSYIFEPIRKEYYWTDEPFDEEKITRLEKYV